MTLVRRAVPDDAEAIMRLADRLQEGVAPWRDRAAVLAAVRGWARDSIDAIDDPDTAMFVAERGEVVVGFASASERAHFSGETDTYLGELVVASDAERGGVGRELVEAAADWGRSRGRRRIVVDTGAANSPARRFYTALGFDDEDITVSRAID